MSNVESGQGARRKNRMTELLKKRPAVDRKMRSVTSAISATDTAIRERTANTQVDLADHRANAAYHERAAAEHRAGAAAAEKRIGEESIDLQSERDAQTAALRPLEDERIVIDANLAEYRKVADKIGVLSRESTTERERAEIVEFFVSDKGHEMLTDLREVEGVDFAGPETFRARQDPSVIAEQTAGPDATEKARLRALARAGDPDAIISYFVGTESEEKIRRRLDIYGFGNEEYMDKLDNEINKRLERDAVSDNPSQLLRAVYPERFTQVVTDGVPRQIYSADTK